MDVCIVLMCHYAPYNGNEVYVLVTFIWNTDIESVQEISPIRRDVGIVGGTHCYDWWLVNGTGVHGS